MKKISICFSFLLLCLVPVYLSACQKHDHDGHDHEYTEHHEEHDHDEDDHDLAEKKQPAHHNEHEHDEYGQDAHTEGIVLTPEAQKTAGLKTAKLEPLPLVETITVTGRISQDIENVFYVNSPQAGTVIDCPKELGETVVKGDVLCLIKVDDSDQLLEIQAPEAGVITTDFAQVGERVDTISPIHTIANFSKLSANFDVYEKDLRLVHSGQKMTIQAAAYLDQTFDGKIVFISPRVDEETFTIKIKALIHNQDNLLKPGMSVTGQILSQDEKFYLMVPSEAIQTIEGEKLIFVQTDEKTFLPKKVVVKSENSKQAAIQQGLTDGEVVVVEGSFILKSKMLESEMEHGHSH